MSNLQRLSVYSAVAINGALVMALELLGTRVVGSFFGTSLFVWGALISVTLVAMVAGYVVGGVYGRRLSLQLITAVAGLFVSVIPSLSRLVLASTDGLGARSGALTSGAALFFVPIAALSMTGPMSISLLLGELSRSGKVSGTTLALSTGGSVFGTLVFAFILLPTLPTTSVIHGSAALLLLEAFVLWLILGRQKDSKQGAVIFACAIGCGAGWAHDAQRAPANGRFEVRFETENHYGRLRVVDDAEMSIRWLFQDSSLISAARRGDPNPVFNYLSLVEALLGFAPSAKSALVIGLGAGHVPRTFEAYGLEVDSIELNPAVASAAKEYFHFEPRGKVIIGDARYELRQLDKHYDLIVHDCFSGGTVPAHVLSLEMMEQIRARLSDGGVLVTSFFGDTTGEDARATQMILKTLKAVFAHVRVFVPRSDTQPIDIAFVASNRPIVMDETFAPRYRSAVAMSFAKGLDGLEISLDERDAAVARDDLNPLELWQARKAELYRAFLIEKLGVDVFL